MLEVGTRSWAEALRDVANRLPLLRELAGGFSATFALAFLEDDDHPTRRTLVRIEDGVVVEADEVDEATFATADVRLTAECQAWGALLDGSIEPLRAILLRRVRMDGDRLLLLRGLPSAKALIEAARELDADFTSAP